MKFLRFYNEYQRIIIAQTRKDERLDRLLSQEIKDPKEKDFVTVARQIKQIKGDSFSLHDFLVDIIGGDK